MALFSIVCWDKPGALDQRLGNRPDHVAYLQSHAGILRLAGPMLDDEGNPCGSLLVVEVADKTAAQAFADGDPYALKGVFAKVDIRGFTKTMGSWS